ncbi:hypothetical protein RhiTH_006925 [Rhizoctonia solani]
MSAYFINQGHKATMRVAPTCSLILVIYHLKVFQHLAESLWRQLHAALAAFHVTVAAETRLIHKEFREGESAHLLDEIDANRPFHLAIVFLTEGDPQGGWWHTSQHGNQKSSSVAEDQFLETCLYTLRKIARRALTARVFGVSCGFNLQTKGSLNRIKEYLQRTAFTSIVLPSTCSLLMCEYLYMMPEIFVNLYYFGAGLDRTLFGVWGRSKEARIHTGLVIMDRAEQKLPLNVRQVQYAPIALRPLGVQLPVARAICGCSENLQTDWAFKKQLPNGPEIIFIYRSRCCGMELQVGIFPGSRKQLVYHEVTFMSKVWDTNKRLFGFHPSRNVRMKLLPPNEEKKPYPVDIGQMWTKAGSKALAVESSMNVAE